jgi:hypothetical protein
MEQLDGMCRSTEASIEEAALTGLGALSALQAQHSGYASSAQEVLTPHVPSLLTACWTMLY